MTAIPNDHEEAIKSWEATLALKDGWKKTSFKEVKLKTPAKYKVIDHPLVVLANQYNEGRITKKQYHEAKKKYL